MPEWGMLPLPKKMLQRGVRGMVRISDSVRQWNQMLNEFLDIGPSDWVSAG